MIKFARNYTFRNPLRTIDFAIGQSTVDAEVIEAARAAGVLEETEDASDGPVKGSAPRRPLNPKG